MATFLFDKTIFGPVKSRRLGNSLGVNLLPNNQKLCNFNCIYCECGWNSTAQEQQQLPSVQEVVQELEHRLRNMIEYDQPLDSITFAGNGEPTLHPDFATIVEITKRLRDQYFPEVVISVLSNATRILDPEVRQALQLVDNPILKLDTAVESTFQLINKPAQGVTLAKVIEGLQAFEKPYILQTLFLKGNVDGINVDNSSKHEMKAWMEIIERCKPKQIMLYSLERDTPLDSLQKIQEEDLAKIAKVLQEKGIDVITTA